MSNSLRPHELQHTRPPCPSPTPGVCSNSCPSSRWCHPTISSPVIPFSSCPHLPASGSFPMSQLFAWGSQCNGVSASASVLQSHLRSTQLNTESVAQNHPQVILIPEAKTSEPLLSCQIQISQAARLLFPLPFPSSTLFERLEIATLRN